MASPSTPSPDPIIGIDLGTTNSVVALTDAHGPRILLDPTSATGSRAILPSVVRYAVTPPLTLPSLSGGEGQGNPSPRPSPSRGEGASIIVEAVGDEARDHAVEFPERTIYSVKRLMGRSIKDAAPDLPYLAYTVIPGPNNTTRIQIPPSSTPPLRHSATPPLSGGATPPLPSSGSPPSLRRSVAPSLLSPEQVSATILRALKDRASRALGREVTRAVVTVPAYFDDAQRQATRDAGRLAGLDIVRIVNEPTAAALAYGLGVISREPQTIAVYDLGGGTFDVSILAITPSEEAMEPGEATKRRSDEATTPDEPEAQARVPSEPRASATGSASSPGSAGEGRVRALSSTHPSSSCMSSSSSSSSSPSSSASSAFNSPADFFQVLSTSGDTHLGGDDIDQLIVKLIMDEIAEQFGVSGFSSTSPLRHSATSPLPPATLQALRAFAETTKIRLSTEDRAAIRIDLGPDDSGVPRIYERSLTRNELEAAMRPLIARSIDSCRRALRDAKRTPADIDRVVMVGGSTRIPLVRRMVGEFFGKEPYTALDPDLVVALGASVQASIVAGLDRSRLLLDVIPLSLGVETVGGAVAKLIIRNQTVPARATEKFTTSVDGQTSIKIHVLQGEREMAADCRSLGEFHLRGVPPMPAGVPQLEVEFLVDTSGVLNVSAFEKRSGRRAALQVIPSHGLSRAEVDRMESESFAHAREDMNRHRIVDLIANARLDAKWTRDQLARIRPKLESPYIAELQSKITALVALIDKADADWRTVNPDDFHRAKEDLDRATIRMHEISIVESLREDAR